jgi:hypothetical protein
MSLEEDFMKQKRESFKTTILEVDSRDGIICCLFQHDGFPLDFNSEGRIKGSPPSFFVYQVQGFSPNRTAREYLNFGKQGLSENVKVRIYHAAGRPDSITYVVPWSE